MSLMGERKFCVMCGKDVEILDVIPHEDHDEQVLSCGHTFKFVDANASDTISITDMVERQVTKIRTLPELIITSNIFISILLYLDYRTEHTG